jgi:hypothetical protein
MMAPTSAANTRVRPEPSVSALASTVPFAIVALRLPPRAPRDVVMR